MSRPWLTVIALGTVAMLCACNGQAGKQAGTPTTRPSASGASGQSQLAAWQQKGATEIPPASLGQVTLGSILVVNKTSGAVSDADARKWAEGLLRSSAYAYWASAQLQDRFLEQGGLSTAPDAVFATNLDDIGKARAAGMRIEIKPLTVRRLVLVPVSQSLQQVFVGNLAKWTPYAFFMDQIGPSEEDWIDGSGQRMIKQQKGSGVPVPELVGGEFAHDALIGDIWTAGSDWDCTNSGTRQVFGQLCNE